MPSNPQNKFYHNKQALPMGCGITKDETDHRIYTQLRLEQANRELQQKNNMIAQLEKENKKLLKDLDSKKIHQSSKSFKKIQIYQMRWIPFSSRKEVTISESFLTAQQNQEEKIQQQLNQQTQKIPFFVYECPICYRQYDLKHRIPFMICHNQHTLCQLCLDSLIMTSRKLQCPQCRSNMCGKVKNLHICKYLEESKKLLENSEKMKKKAISQSNSPSKQDLIGFSNYTFKLPYIKPTKQDQHTFDLFFNQILSQKSLQRIHIQVSPSKSNKIQFGVIDRYFIDHDKVTSPSTGILYSLCDGRVMGTQTKMTNLTEWRDGGKPVMPNTTNRVVMEVDMAGAKVRWLVNEEVYAETIINDYIKTRQAVVYLAMYDRRDEVKLNVIW